MTPITRPDALAAGLLHYCTGKPCLRGHTGPRFVSTGNCVACGNERAKTYAAVARQQKVIRLRPDSHEFLLVQVHADDREALLKALDWLNAQRGRPPAPRPQATQGAAPPPPADTRTQFERFLDMHINRYDLATIRRLAASSGYEEVYSPGRCAPDASRVGAAAQFAAGLDREGYLPDELPTT